MNASFGESLSTVENVSSIGKEKKKKTSPDAIAFFFSGLLKMPPAGCLAAVALVSSPFYFFPPPPLFSLVDSLGNSPVRRRGSEPRVVLLHCLFQFLSILQQIKEKICFLFFPQNKRNFARVLFLPLLRVCAAPSRCVENYRSVTFANATKKCFFLQCSYTHEDLSLVSLTILCVCVCVLAIGEREVWQREGSFLLYSRGLARRQMDAQLLGRERRKVEKEEAVSHLPACRK